MNIYKLIINTWQDHYIILFKICHETYIQIFQYRIFQRFFHATVPFQYGKKAIAISVIDYPEYYFYTCTDVNTLWTSIQHWWKSVLDTAIKIDVNSILFGIANTEDDCTINIVNLCILHGKWNIYSCKNDNVELFILNYIKMVKDKLCIENVRCELNGDK